MKWLRRMLLVNWHYYDLEWIEFDRVNFLTGKTGSGKSTLVDALQIVLLGDTNGQTFFNKAANDRSRRQLKGYLRGEYADDGGTGYLVVRGANDEPFTSYIACEFEDDERKSYFTLGVAFDCNYTATDEHTFFILKDRIPSTGFIGQNAPMPIKDLKGWLKRTYAHKDYDVCATAQEYRQKILSHFGPLGDRFFTLLRKAVSFSPIIDIEGFITQNLCDARKPPDLGAMQDHIRQYKRLEQEADLMQAQIAHLELVAKTHAELAEGRERRKIYAYLLHRADVERLVREEARLRTELGAAQARLASDEAEERQLAEEAARLGRERDALYDERARNTVQQKLKSLEAEKDTTTACIAALERAVEDVANALVQYGLAWRASAEGLALLAAEVGEPGESAALAEGKAAAATAAEALHDVAEHLLDVRPGNVATLDVARFDRIRLAATEFGRQHSLFGGRLEQRLRDRRTSLADCDAQLAQLRNRIKPFDSAVRRLKAVLEKELEVQLGRAVRVDVLADCLEISDPRWTNVIEGYLSKQKQYLLVEPGCFVPALKIAERMRREEGLHDIGLVDGDKVLQSAPQRLPGSLAEAVETEDPQARAYVDFLLGHLIRCDRVEDLRNHERSVTDTGMLYQGYVASPIHPRLWESPLIGARAIERQIEHLEKQRPGLEAAVVQSAAWTSRFATVRPVQTISENEAQQYIDRLRDAEALPGLRTRLDAVKKEIAGLDLTWVNQITERIAAQERILAEVLARARSVSSCIGEQRQVIRGLTEASIPRVMDEVRATVARLEREYSKVWREEIGEPRFQEELAAKGTPERVIADYRSQVGMRDSQLETLQQKLTNLRAEFNRAYQASLDVASDDNGKYDALLGTLREQKLPEYGDKIRKARDMAYEQFMSQFLNELKMSIDDVQERIRVLNRALKDYRWGTDQYSFQVQPNPDYRHFYDMIMDPDLMEGNNIMSASFRARHQKSIEELFGRLESADTAVGADARAEMERNIRTFTDFKTYLRFDMLSTDDQNQSQRLSRTIMKKSGGETQTPFYVAMLASFAQLYHLADRKWNCIRLIVFDEAFSKMDGERIRESLQMLSRNGFQCILSAPPEKIGDIAPLVDRNLAVIRKGQSSSVHAFDPRHFDAEVAESLEEG